MSLWLLALAAVVAAPWIAEGLRRPVATLRGSDATLARLREGAVHFRWHGPEGGRVVVLIHGLTTASYVFAPQVAALTGAGFRVLTFDHYGRGLSDDGPAAQTAEMFLEEVTGLFDHLGLAVPVPVVGYSMGGAVATVLAARRPDRVSRVVLIAPAGLAPLTWGRWGALLAPPVLGHWIATVPGPALLRREIRGAVAEVRDHPDLVARQLAETRRRGYMPAVRASVRGILSRTLDADHRAIAGHGIALTAIWAAGDGVIPIASRARLEALNPAARQITIAGAAHGLAYTHAEAVNAALLEALSDG